MNLIKKYQTAILQLLPKGHFFGQLHSIKKALFVGIAKEFKYADDLFSNLQAGTLLENDFLLEHFRKFIGKPYALEVVRRYTTQQLEFSKTTLENLIKGYFNNYVTPNDVVESAGSKKQTLEIGKTERMHANSPCNSPLASKYDSTDIFINVNQQDLKFGQTPDEKEATWGVFLQVLMDFKYLHTTIIINENSEDSLTI